MGPFSARSKRSSYTGSDVFGGSEDDSVMADKRAKKGAKNYCAAGGPNKVNCSNKTGTPGIAWALLSQGGKFAAEMVAICADKSERFRAEEVIMPVFRSL